MLLRTIRFAESLTVLGLLAGSAALMHVAAARGERRRRAALGSAT